VLWNVPAIADDPSPEEIAAAAPPYVGRRVVALTGSLFPDKGLRVALEACALLREQHPDVLFAFIGSLLTSQTEVNGWIESLAIAEHVRFQRSLPYRTLLAHLKHASVGLALSQPARSYSLLGAGNGRKVFTYMQARVPIVAPDFGMVAEVVRRERCGLLVDSSNPEQVARAVDVLLRDHRAATRMGERGRAAFESKHNWEREQARLLRFLQQTSLSS
jgi:glycosyltransferase involved in cell wall biosynthesis